MREIYEDRERKDLQEMAQFLKELTAGTNEELMSRLDEKISKLKEEINEVSDTGQLEYGGIASYDGDVCFETARLLIRRPAEEDKPFFLELKENYSFFKRTFAHDELKDGLWEDHLKPYTLYCSILRRDNSDYVGYCGIKNLYKSAWEIAIELREEYCGKGYGYEAMTAFFDNVTGILGPHEYSSRVAVDNTASQKLMEKLGFEPFGLSEFILHTEEEKREAEEKYAYKIDNRYKELAQRFHTTPEKLISHVLEYRKTISC